MCALEVDGGWAFYTMVEQALRKICPGVIVDGADCDEEPVPAGTGKVTIGANPCDEYCCHRAGCNLLSELIAAGATITIKPGTSSYTELTYSTLALRGVVGWTGHHCRTPARDCCPSCDGECCELDIAAEVELAHELIHAWHDAVKCTYVHDPDGKNEEPCTVCGENQVRREMGYLRRCNYNVVPVDCDEGAPKGLADGYDCQLLDGSSQREEECDCCPDGGDDPPSGPGLSLSKAILVAVTEFFRLDRIWQARKRLLWPWGPRGPTLMTYTQEFDAIGQSGFGDMLTGDDALDRAVEAGARVLMAGRPRHSYPELEQLFDRATDAVILEIVLLAGGYQVLLLAVEAEHAWLVTNIGLRQVGEGQSAFGPRTPLLAYELPTASHGTISTELRQMTSIGPPEDGMGGVRLMSDGRVDFSKVKTDQTIRRTVLRGYEYDPVVPGWKVVKPDGEDGPRWDAIKQIHDLGVQQLQLVREHGIRGVPVEDIPADRDSDA